MQVGSQSPKSRHVQCFCEVLIPAKDFSAIWDGKRSTIFPEHYSASAESGKISMWKIGVSIRFNSLDGVG